MSSSVKYTIPILYRYNNNNEVQFYTYGRCFLQFSRINDSPYFWQNYEEFYKKNPMPNIFKHFKINNSIQIKTEVVWKNSHLTNDFGYYIAYECDDVFAEYIKKLYSENNQLVHTQNLISWKTYGEAIDFNQTGAIFEIKAELYIFDQLYNFFNKISPQQNATYYNVFENDFNYVCVEVSLLYNASDEIFSLKVVGRDKYRLLSLVSDALNHYKTTNIDYEQRLIRFIKQEASLDLVDDEIIDSLISGLPNYQNQLAVPNLCCTENNFEELVKKSSTQNFTLATLQELKSIIIDMTAEKLSGFLDSSVVKNALKDL